MTTFDVTDRRDVIAKRPGRYLSFPGMARVSGDEILLGYRDARAAPGTRSHGIEGDLKLIRWSGGRWSEPRLLYAHEGDVEEMGCGDLTCLADGTVLLWSRQFRSRAYRTHEVHVASSRDGGCTFEPRRPVRFDFFPNGYAPYGKVIEMPGGELLQGAYGIRRPGEKSSAVCLVSRDRGRTWQRHAWIAEATDGRALNYYEPFIVLLPDGPLRALLRTNGTFHATLSTDGGLTWHPPAPAFEGMACAGLVLATGELLVTYRGVHEKHPEKVRETVTVRRGQLYCWRVSADGGATWGPEGVLDDGTAHQIGSYGMGDVVEIEDGRVRVVYYTSDGDQAPWLAECTLDPR